MTQPLLFDDLHAPQLAKPAHVPVVKESLTTRQQPTGEQLKRQGMEAATWGKERLLAHARVLAMEVARGQLEHADGKRRADGLCTADDVWFAWERENKLRVSQGLASVPWLGNGAGQLFGGLPHVWTTDGAMVKSTRPGAHQNLLTVWRLKHA